MADNVLTAQVRTEFGKGPARRARRAGLIPAVIYGHGGDPIHVDLPSHQTFLAVKGQSNVLLTVEVDGQDYLALVREIQRHPVSREILHIDLLTVSRGELVEVAVPLVVVGTPAPGNQYTIDDFTLLVKAPATAIPERIEVSVEGLEDGAVVRVADVTFPEGVECELDPDQDIVSVSKVKHAEEPEEDAAGADEPESA